jgi:CheY-like chemotaxis protein
MKILVCDDDPVCLAVIRRKLEGEKDVEVVLAKDGWEAMQQLSGGHTFDLVITDIHMPHHTGDQILAFIRHELKSNLPIIMFSADGEEEVVAMAKKEGVDTFIKKPVKPDEILKAVKKLVRI